MPKKKIKDCFWYYKGKCLAPNIPIIPLIPKCKDINCIMKDEKENKKK